MERAKDAARVDSLEVPHNDLELHACTTVFSDLHHENRPRTVPDRSLVQLHKQSFADFVVDPDLTFLLVFGASPRASSKHRRFRRSWHAN